MSDKDPKLIKRREFSWNLGFASIGISIGGASILSLQYLKPNVLFEAPTKFKAGRSEEYQPGSITVNVERKVYIVRKKEGSFYALSSVCTHLGCITNYQSAVKRIACPCHGSLFDLEGNVLSGPAPRSLKRILIEQNDRGVLVVDTSVDVSEDYVLRV